MAIVCIVLGVSGIPWADNVREGVPHLPLDQCLLAMWVRKAELNHTELETFLSLWNWRVGLPCRILLLYMVAISSIALPFQGLTMTVHNLHCLSPNNLILKDNFLSAPVYKPAILLLLSVTLSQALEVSISRLFPQLLPTFPTVTLDLMIINYIPRKNFFHFVAA